jgi:hypothetical protein
MESIHLKYFYNVFFFFFNMELTKRIYFSVQRTSGTNYLVRRVRNNILFEGRRV